MQDRRRSPIPLVATLLVLALVGLLVYGMFRGGDDSTLDDAVKRGDRPPAPGLQIPLQNLHGGGTTTLASLRGKIVVLNFWAHWCDPCRDEAPVLNRIHARLERERLGTVLGATYDDPPQDARAFMRRYDVRFPSATDVGTKLAREFGTNKLPETFVIDREGRIVAISRGQVEYDFLARAIDQATKQ